MDWTKPSLAHYRYIRSLPYKHLPSGLDYWIRQEGVTLYVAFAETFMPEPDGDWNDNLNFFPSKYEIYKGLKAHSGYAKQYLSIRDTLMDYLYGGTVKQIFVSGYSLGGAMTVLAVQDIGYHIDRDKLNIKVYGIAYCPPRAFCAFSKLVKCVVKDRLVLVKVRNDPFGYLPLPAMLIPFTFRFKPFGLRFAPPWKWLSFWSNYGKVIRIGKPWRFLPFQHRPEQVERALLEKYHG